MSSCPPLSQADLAKPPEYIRLFVQDVLEFSSQYGKENSNSYTVANIRSRPHYYPKYGDFLESCVLRTYGPWWPKADKIPIAAQPLFISTDFIEVQFEHKLLIESVVVYETYNPGAVCALYAFDYAIHRWICVWSIFHEDGYQTNADACNRYLPARVSRKFEPNLTIKNVFSDKIRLEFESSRLDYYAELDAVEISGIAYDKPKINRVATGLKKTASLFNNLTLNNTNTSLDHHENKDSFNMKSIDRSETETFPPSSQQTLTERRASIKSISRTTNILRRNSSTEKPPSTSIVSCANIVELPNEILCMILTYLDLKTIFRLRSTCSTFYELCSLPFLYNRLDLQPYWNLINSDFIDYLTSVTESITMLNLSWIKLEGTGLNLPVASLFQNSCKNLTVLQLNSCNFMTGSLLTQVTRNCKQLVSLSLRSCTNIESVRDECRDGFIQIKDLKNLKFLDLYRTLCSQVAIIEILTSCNKIESLNLGACVKINDFDQVMSVISVHIKGIKCLDLWRAYSLTSRGINELSKSCFALEELDIGWCRAVVPIDSIQELVENCKNLRKMFLTSLKITDDELEMISKHLTKLEMLDILGSNLVSYEGVEMFLTNTKTLKLFDLSFCIQIDAGMHQLLQRKFTHCDIKKEYIKYY